MFCLYVIYLVQFWPSLLTIILTPVATLACDPVGSTETDCCAELCLFHVLISDFWNKMKSNSYPSYPCLHISYPLITLLEINQYFIWITIVSYKHNYPPRLCLDVTYCVRIIYIKSGNGARIVSHMVCTEKESKLL